MKRTPAPMRARGLAVLELAIALPVLLTLVVWGLDYSLQIYARHTMKEAAHNAARHMAVREGTTEGAISAAESELSGLNANFTVTAGLEAVDSGAQDVVVTISVPRSDVSVLGFEGTMQVEVRMRKEEG